MKALIVLTLMLVPTVARAQVYFGPGKAVDGDSLELSGEMVRLHGIDAVEATQTCLRGNEAWDCGKDAKAHLSSLISSGSVQCQQRDRDVYGRVVAACNVGNIDLAQAMVEGGLAVALPQFSQAYVETEARVRSLKFGIWGTDFQMPADYRAANPHLKPSLPKPVVSSDPSRQYALPQSSYRPSRPGSGVYYRNCDAARAAGAAPIYRGQPGYRSSLDGDNDGIACEPYRGR